MRLLAVFLMFAISGCVANAPFRSSQGTACDGHWSGCGDYYEKHEGYDLGFVEFTERGNDFAPRQTAEILSTIKDYAKTNDVALVVFIHGWKHNASTEDGNVISFNKALAHIAKSKVTGDKKLIGIYIGWRGMSFHGLQLENLTFWDRKAVAEEVGHGGVTNFLIDLEHIAAQKNKHFMLTIGHSFGAAIALSALHDTLLDKMKSAEREGVLKPFGDGVILLNPAIEADQALLLKESSMRIGALDKPVPSAMYVISSRADMPTNVIFPLGQFFGVTLRWSQAVIQRDYDGYRYTLREKDLDGTTVGNYAMFTTAFMDDEATKPIPERQSSLLPSSDPAPFFGRSKMFALSLKDPIGPWGLKSYCSPTAPLEHEKRFPCFDNDPIDFISVPESFIANHNDIFNTNVISLLTTIVNKSLSERQGVAASYCSNNGVFSFGKCFAHYFELNSKIPYLN